MTHYYFGLTKNSIYEFKTSEIEDTSDFLQPPVEISETQYYEIALADPTVYACEWDDKGFPVLTKIGERFWCEKNKEGEITAKAGYRFSLQCIPLI